jgi:DNA-nicking Smr family endonuclease
MSRRRHRPPTPEELRLWEAVTHTVMPLGQRRPGAPKPDAAEPADGKAGPGAKATPPPDVAVAAPSRPKPALPPALSPIDRRTRTRLSRGTVSIDARIDLHGLTQAAAHGRLARFLRQAQADGAKLVLVITGKGKPRGEFGGEERGVLRRAVPMWLASAEMRPLVVGFDEAGPTHGGGGALYVRVRSGRR